MKKRSSFQSGQPGVKWRIAGVEMMNFGNDHRVIPQLPPIVANYHSPVNSRII